MAGHSQFKNIMHRKGAQDAKRARHFAKLIREITVSARQGLPDPAFNPRLRAAMSAAREANMPRDTIERAVKKATGAGGGDDYVEVRYEGYGPAGVAVIVETLTDNRNRTASDVRAAFNKHGGALGETNSVSFMFSHLGVIEYPVKAASADAMLEAAIEAGAQDFEPGHEDGVTLFLTDHADLDRVSRALPAQGFSILSAKLGYKPKNPISPASLSAGDLNEVEAFLAAIDANDDVQNVFVGLAG